MDILVPKNAENSLKYLVWPQPISETYSNILMKTEMELLLDRNGVISVKQLEDYYLIISVDDQISFMFSLKD